MHDQEVGHLILIHFNTVGSVFQIQSRFKLWILVGL